MSNPTGTNRWTESNNKHPRSYSASPLHEHAANTEFRIPADIIPQMPVMNDSSSVNAKPFMPKPRRSFSSPNPSASDLLSSPQRLQISSRSSSPKSKPKVSTAKAKRGGYSPLSSSNTVPAYSDERYSLDAVSPRGAGSDKDDSRANPQDSSSDTDDEERPLSVASNNSGERLVHSSRKQRSKRRSKKSRRNERRRRSDADVSYAPSLMDIPQSPALDGPQRYHDSLVNPPEDFENPVPPVTPLSAQQFLAIVDEVRAAIDEGIYPTLISQGSSGSYFCKNRQGQIVGVFKPKNEEPYGHLNPKWTKWIHKNLFPCCFGRSCIIPNLGYISEAAASYIDRRLKLNVVPRTEVVYLAAPTFYYSRKDWKLYRKGETLPEKVGSFQVFLNGYKDATRFFREGYEKRRRASSVNTSARNSSENLMSGSEHGRSSDNLNRPPSDNANGAFDWSELSQKQFQWGFERLVVLDYLIRNTDRGLDNWMVKFDESRDEAEKAKQRVVSQSSTPLRRNTSNPMSIRDHHKLRMSESAGGSHSFTAGQSDAASLAMAHATMPAVPASFPLANGLSEALEQHPPHEHDDRAPETVPPGVTSDVPDQTRLVNHHHDSQSSTAPHTIINMDTPVTKVTSVSSVPPSSQSATPTPDEDPEEDPIIQVAAIDNGLAFPWKHPDRWRSYPYGWAYLPAARIPFSRETRILVLHLLTSPSWWRETMEGLEKLFRIDSDFSESMWRKQRAVVRGEGYNLVETLRRSEVDGRGGSPWGLIRRPVVAVYEEEILDEGEDGEADMARWAEGVLGGPSAGMRPGRRRSFVERQSRRFAKRVRQRFETFARSRPCFENW